MKISKIQFHSDNQISFQFLLHCHWVDAAVEIHQLFKSKFVDVPEFRPVNMNINTSRNKMFRTFTVKVDPEIWTYFKMSI